MGLPMLCLQAQNIWVILGSSLSLAFCLLLYHRSVQFSCSVVSDSLRPHEPQHTRLLCPSPTSGTHPNSCPLSRWCHPTISPSVVPFPPALNLSQHQGLFKMSQLFASGGQRIGVSASTLVLPMNTQDWSQVKVNWLSFHNVPSYCCPWCYLLLPDTRIGAVGFNLFFWRPFTTADAFHQTLPDLLP